MEFKALFRAENRLSDFGVSAIFHESQQKMADGQCERFFQEMRCRNDKEKLRELFKSEGFKRLKEETAWTIAVHLDRNRLETRIEKGEFGMCIALDELIADERAEGRIEGRGSIIRNMIQQGLDEEFICRITGCTKQEFASAAES